MRIGQVLKSEVEPPFQQDDDKELNQLLNQTFTISSFEDSSDGTTKELYKLHRPASKTKSKKGPYPKRHKSIVVNQSEKMTSNLTKMMQGIQDTYKSPSSSNQQFQSNKKITTKVVQVNTLQTPRAKQSLTTKKKHLLRHSTAKLSKPTPRLDHFDETVDSDNA